MFVVVGFGFKLILFERVIKIIVRDIDGWIFEFGVYRLFGFCFWFINMMVMLNLGGKLWLFIILSWISCWFVVVDVYLWIDNINMNIILSVVIVVVMLLNVYMIEFIFDKIMIWFI